MPFHFPTFLLLCSSSLHRSSLLSLQSLDEDCTLEEEDEGLVEEEDEINQFNDDTFGAGANGEFSRKFEMLLVKSPYFRVWKRIAPMLVHNYSLSLEFSYKKKVLTKVTLVKTIVTMRHWSGKTSNQSCFFYLFKKGSKKESKRFCRKTEWRQPVRNHM